MKHSSRRLILNSRHIDFYTWYYNYTPVTKVIKLFLLKEVYEELLYQYEGKDRDLRKLIFGYLTPLGTDGKMAILNGSINTKQMKYTDEKQGDKTVKVGKMSMVPHDLKDFDLNEYTLESDPDWLPEKCKMEELSIYKLTISDRLYADLMNFVKIYAAGFQFYNDSLDKEAKDFKKDDIAVLPTCFEEVIQNFTVNALQAALTKNIGTGYEEEFEELEKKITVAPSRKKGK